MENSREPSRRLRGTWLESRWLAADRLSSSTGGMLPWTVYSNSASSSQKQSVHHQVQTMSRPPDNCTVSSLIRNI